MGIDYITDFSVRAQRGMSKIFANDHILIVNFPSEDRVRQLIAELESDLNHNSREIIVICHDLEALPFEHERVLFVRGGVLERDTYRRAKIESAKMAIILATSYQDSNSDAVVASTAAVIDGLKPEIHIVAECVNHKHRDLFNAVRCDAVVCSMKISGNLLAQEVHDPGVAQLLDDITSNTTNTTLYSTAVTAVPNDPSYNDLAKQWLDVDINLLCINRDGEILTSFLNLTPQDGDNAIYAAEKRYAWHEMMQA